jgi:hypothetical protein
MVLILGNSAWEVLRNPFEDTPFFTSDFPAAIEEGDDPRVVSHTVPLTPCLALRICPDVSLKHEKLDFTFSRLRGRVRKIGRDEIRNINRLLVQCAEDLVFYRDDYSWVKPFARYAPYHIDTQAREIQTPEGAIVVSRQRVVERH